MEGGLPPTKPPRGVKSPKETSGLLMSIIRTLSTRESNQERDKEKAKLERDFKKIDQQLNDLVSERKEDLTNVMQLFSKMSSVITNLKETLHARKEGLVACKVLLSCGQDGVRKLWLEGVEHKHVLDSLEQIEKLREVPSKLDQHLIRKEYISATKLLISALNSEKGFLEKVEALRELRTELNSKKEKLYQKLIEELLRELYLYDDKSSDQNSSGSKEKNKWTRKGLENSENSNDELLEGEKQQNRMSSVVECLAHLNKIQDAVDSLKSTMHNEIVGLVRRESKKLITKPAEGAHPLLDLLEILISKFRAVASNHFSLISCLSSTATSFEMSVTLFQPTDIWSTIQSVLQLLLTDYLDIQNTAVENAPTPVPLPDQSMDISSFFSRRRPQRSRKNPLFKFEYSSNFQGSTREQVPHITLNSYEPGRQREKLLVCSTDPHNITVIFVPLLTFIEELETVHMKGNGVCALNTFVNDYVRDVFIGREHARILAKIDSATKTADAWKNPTPPHLMNEVEVKKPLLQSTVLVSNAIKELEKLLDTLPTHKEQVLSMMLGLIRGYTETCQAAYRGIVQPEPEDKRLCSAAWLKDEDISRFLKSLPNWIDLQAQKTAHRSGKSLKREDTVEEESPEDVRQRNVKEAEILATNLGEGGVGQHEIISDHNQLKYLALLQESMEWFSFRVLQLHGKLKKICMSSGSSSSSKPVTQLMPSVLALVQDFEELSNTCLLVLHLEVRVQCFHYLLPKGTPNGPNGGNAQDPDPKVLDLSRVLISIYESLSSTLQPRKTKYVFEGLGHLIAKILMSSVQYMDNIDECAIHKMCRNIFTLQQTLTNITFAREIALDRAQHYFQLFFSNPDDILNRVLEKGPEFSELEYMTAFQLIHKSHDTQEPNALQRQLQRLSDILGEVGVTV